MVNALKLLIFSIAFAMLATSIGHGPPHRDGVSVAHRWGRSLLSKKDKKECSHPTGGAVEEFPKDFFTCEQRKHGWVAVHIVLVLYTFGLLAVVCDDYFILSLYHISSRMRLDKDVAGATFMAIGSSAPTLFITLVSIFCGDRGGDVGLGTVVGSTIFNTLFITGVCGVVASGSLSLQQWPLLRDSFVYTLSTLALVLTVRDGEVHWYEAMSFIFIYLFYIVIMFFNRRLARIYNKLTDSYGACGTVDQSCTQERLPIETTDKNIQTSMHGRTQNTSCSEEMLGNDSSKFKRTDDCCGAGGRSRDMENCTYDEQLAMFEDKQKSPLRMPDGLLARLWWVMGMPVMLLFYVTIPPCCQRRWENWFLVTFFVSVMWMGFLSYVLVWMICIIGDTFGIPDCVMGMTFLAAGSSIPDVMASVIVIRQDLPDMAVSNAIGSNVFDMLCLGVPWLVKTTIINGGSSVLIESTSISISAMLLIGSIVFLVLAVHANHWRLNMRLGVVFIIMYVAFISLATALELLGCPCLEDLFML